MYSELNYFSPPDFLIPPRFPTADGHLHANGAATNADRRKQAKALGVDLTLPPEQRDIPHIDPKGLHRLEWDGRCIWADDGFYTSHDAFDQSVKLFRDPSSIKNMLREHLIREGNGGCIYKRILSSAMNNCRNADEAIKTYDDNMQAMIQAIQDAKAATGIEAFIWASGKRHLNEPIEQAHNLLNAVEAFIKKHKGNRDIVDRLVGFEMAGNETNSDDTAISLAIFGEVYERAMKLGLATGSHASEYLDASDVTAALTLPNIKCIDQALRLAEDSSVVQKVIDKELLVTQLLVSNGMLHKNWLDPNGDLVAANHPMPLLHKAGVRLCLGTDDPGMQEIRGRRADLGTTIADEYGAAAALGFDPRALLGFTANAVYFGVMPPDVKNDRLKIIQNYASQNSRMLGPTRSSGRSSPIPGLDL